MFFFSKSRHSDLDLEPSTLNFDLARDIIIPNICVKLYQNPLINVGVRAMTIFSKNSHSDLDREPRTLKV